MNKIKVICYYRVSTKGQGESGLGLEAQQSYMKHFLKSDNYEIVKEFTEVASAKTIDCKKRPLLCQAIELCKKNGYTLAVAKLDRLSRDLLNTLQVFEQLEERLFSCDIPTQNGRIDKMMLQLIGAFAERERMLISLRTKGALDAKKERGETWNRNSTWTDSARDKGLTTIKENAATNKNTSRAKNYATILRTQGKTLENIADVLNKEAFTTAKGKQFNKALVKYLIDK